MGWVRIEGYYDDVSLIPDVGRRFSVLDERRDDALFAAIGCVAGGGCFAQLVYRGGDSQIVRLPGSVVSVSAAPCDERLALAVDARGRIYELVDHGYEPVWRPMVGVAVSVSQGSKFIWCTNSSMEVFRRTRSGAWKRVRGILTQVSADFGRLVGVNADGEIFFGRDEIVPQFKDIRGRAKHVCVRGSLVVAVSVDGVVFYTRSGRAWYPLVDHEEHSFNRVSTDGTSVVSLKSDGSFWRWVDV